MRRFPAVRMLSERVYAGTVARGGNTDAITFAKPRGTATRAPGGVLGWLLACSGHADAKYTYLRWKADDVTTYEPFTITASILSEVHYMAEGNMFGWAGLIDFDSVNNRYSIAVRLPFPGIEFKKLITLNVFNAGTAGAPDLTYTLDTLYYYY